MDCAKHSCTLFRYLPMMFSGDADATGSIKTAPQSHSVSVGGTDCVSVGGQRD